MLPPPILHPAIADESTKVVLRVAGLQRGGLQSQVLILCGRDCFAQVSKDLPEDRCFLARTPSVQDSGLIFETLENRFYCCQDLSHARCR